MISLPGSPEGSADAGTDKGFAQRQRDAVDQRLPDTQHAHGQRAENGAPQEFVFAFQIHGKGRAHLSATGHGRNGQQNGHAHGGQHIRMDRRQPVMHPRHDDGKENAPNDKAGDRAACLNRMHRIITQDIRKKTAQGLENKQAGKGNKDNCNQRRKKKTGGFRNPFVQSCFNESRCRAGQQGSKDAAPPGNQRRAHEGDLRQTRSSQQRRHGAAQSRGAAEFFAGVQSDESIQDHKDGTARQLQILNVGIARQLRTDLQQKADQPRQQSAADKGRDQRDKDVAHTLQHPL